MTLAWYGHLKWFKEKHIIIVVIISWLLAFIEYCFQVPANRLGSKFFTLPQLKVIQEIITMFIFAGFYSFVMKSKLSMDYFYATLCLVAAAFFMFRGGGGPHP